jgi:hypothetical protein
MPSGPALLAVDRLKTPLAGPSASGLANRPPLWIASGRRRHLKLVLLRELSTPGEHARPDLKKNEQDRRGLLGPRRDADDHQCSASHREPSQPTRLDASRMRPPCLRPVCALPRTAAQLHCTATRESHYVPPRTRSSTHAQQHAQARAAWSQVEVEPSWGEITPAGRKGAKAQPADRTLIPTIAPTLTLTLILAPEP